MTNIPKRVIVICEGQSESAFVNRILSGYILTATSNAILLQSRIVVTSKDRRRGRKYTGGIVSFGKAWNDIKNSISENVPVATMFDYFRLPADFPGYEESRDMKEDSERVKILEDSLKQKVKKEFPNFPESYFIPYLQLHEFETLFYCDLDQLKTFYLSQEEQNAIDGLKREVAGLAPEEINHGPETAPSKRLLKALNYHKGDNASDILERIGIDQMLNQCPHFSSFVQNLERLSSVD